MFVIFVEDVKIGETSFSFGETYEVNEIIDNFEPEVKINIGEVTYSVPKDSFIVRENRLTNCERFAFQFSYKYINTIFSSFLDAEASLQFLSPIFDIVVQEVQECREEIFDLITKATAESMTEEQAGILYEFHDANPWAMTSFGKFHVVMQDGINEILGPKMDKVWNEHVSKKPQVH